jgi:probable F420-dependent oxidoreductase
MKMRFGLWYDFRNPRRWSRPSSELYAQILEQIVRAEAMGWDDVWLSEHHFIDDGYLPSCLPTAAAVAARTTRMRIGAGIMQLPLHHPVRLAEDAAVVDVLSGGRLDLGLGLGYRPEEYEGNGLPWRSRRARFEEAFGVLRALFAGKRVDFDGRHFQVKGALLRPLPVQMPFPLLVGGLSEAAVRRAARLGDGLIVSGEHDAGSGVRIYRDELAKLGREGDANEVVYFEQWLLVARDPERRLREAAPHIGYQLARYAAWGRGVDELDPVSPSLDDLAAMGVRVLRPEQAIDHIRGVIDEHRINRFLSWTLPPGLPPEWSDEHIELMAREVIPSL